MIKKEKNSAQSAAVIFGSTETTTPKTSADAILEAAEKSFFKALFNHLGDFGRTFQKGTSSSIEAPFRA